MADHPMSDWNGDKNRGDCSTIPSKDTLDEASVDKAGLGSSAENLSVRERLGRLSNYRIFSFSIVHTVDPIAVGSKIEVVRARCKMRGRHKRLNLERVAVKKLQRSDEVTREDFSKNFVQEVEMLAGLCHVNIVQLVGFLEDFDRDKTWIVLSWEPNGNVREFLASGEWEIAERLSLIKDTFEGLNYLHTRQPPICHGDLTSLNIVVNAAYHAVITGFGSAPALGNVVAGAGDSDMASGTGGAMDEDTTNFQVTVVADADQLTLRGPSRSLSWAAPEVELDEERPNLPSDVWSVGWLCWEIMTKQTPFPVVDEECPTMLPPMCRVLRVKVPAAREDAQFGQIASLCSLMTDCWKLDPKGRPDSAQCLTQVKWMPSPPPLGGTPGSKVLSAQFSLRMGDIKYSQGRYGNAAALFEQARATAVGGGHSEIVAEAWIRLADVHRSQSKYTEAQGFYNGAHNIFVSLGNEHGRADALCGLGEVNRHLSKYMEADQSSNTAYLIYTRLGDKMGQADALQALGDVYRLQSKDSVAEKYLTRAQEIYTSIDDPLGRANTSEKLGQIYSDQSKLAEAEHAYSQAYEIYTRIGDDLGRGKTSDLLGAVYQLQSEYTKAAEFYTLACDIFTGIGADGGQANRLRQLGEVYRLQSKYSEAEAACLRSQDTYVRLNDDVGQAKVFETLGDIYQDQSKYAEAEKSYKQSYEIYARIGDDEGQARIFAGLGDVYQPQSRETEAVEAYIRAYHIFASIGNDEGQASTLGAVGDVYLRQSKFADAERAYSQVRDIYARLGDNAGLAKAFDQLGDAYYDQSKYTEAEQAYIRSHDMYALIRDEERQARLLEGLGYLYQVQSKPAEAESFYIRARDIYVRIGDEEGQAATVKGLGDVYQLQSKPAEAEKLYTEALERYACLGDEYALGRAHTLRSLGDLRRKSAAAFYEEARDIYARIGEPSSEQEVSRWLSIVSTNEQHQATNGSC